MDFRDNIRVNGGTVYHTGNKPSLSDLGAAASNHTHSYMSSGGTYDTVTLNNWIRTKGGSGWFSQDYGGGIHMTDTTWVRTYNNKNFYCNGTILGASIQSDGDIIVKNNGKNFIAPNNYGYCGKLTDGSHTYMLWMGTDNKVCLSYNNRGIKMLGNIEGETKFVNGSYTDPWNGTSCAIKVSGHVGVTGSMMFHSSSGEKTIKCSHNWGMYFNSGALGWYDWANGRSVMAYEVGNNRLVTWRKWYAAGGTQYSLNNSEMFVRLPKEELFTKKLSETRLSIDDYYVQDTEDGFAILEDKAVLRALKTREVEEPNTDEEVIPDEDNENTDHSEEPEDSIKVDMKIDKFYATLISEIQNLKEEVARLKNK